MKVWEINNLLNAIAPYKAAYDFDNVGLLLGDGNREVHKIMLALDVAPEVVEQAVNNKVHLLITHHPIIFKALKNITADNPTGRMLLRLIENNIAVIAMHTNLDIASGGVNDCLAELAGLTDIKVLVEKYCNDFVKLSLFVPQTHSAEIIELLDSMQIRIFGNYQSCSFTSKGTGRFKPLNAAGPFIGTKQELCAVQEENIEMILARTRVNEVIERVRTIHPYEQMAYEVLAVEQPCLEQGIVRIGQLPQAMRATEFAAALKQGMNLEYALLANPDKQISTVAVCGGAGADFIEVAKRSGADALLTGDIKYHEAQAAKYLDLAVIAIGHQESEQPVVQVLADRLKQQADLANTEIILAKQGKILHCI